METATSWLGREKLAAKIQLLIGNTLYGEEKLQQAAEAYAQALRHEPGNMAKIQPGIRQQEN